MIYQNLFDLIVFLEALVCCISAFINYKHFGVQMHKVMSVHNRLFRIEFQKREDAQSVLHQIIACQNDQF